MSLKPASAAAWLLGLSLLGGCGITSQEELFGVMDGTPPRVVETFPGPDWIQVPVTVSVRIWFSEALDPASVGVSSIQLISGQDLAAAVYRVGVEADGRGLVVIEPRQPLIGGVEYLLRISQMVTDLYGNPLEQETVLAFRTLR